MGGLVTLGERHSPTVSFIQGAHGASIAAATTTVIADVAQPALVLNGPTEDFLLEYLVASAIATDASGQLQVNSVTLALQLAGLGATNIPYPIGSIPFALQNKLLGNVGAQLQFFGLIPQRYTWRQLQQLLASAGGAGTHGPISFTINTLYSITNNDGALAHTLNTQTSGFGRRIEGSEVD